jgi:hypothetical protein
MHVPLATAASIAQVKPATIRKWVQRGHIGDYPDGYDVKELLLWLDQRDTGKAVGGIVAAQNNYERRRTA